MHSGHPSAAARPECLLDAGRSLTLVAQLHSLFHLSGPSHTVVSAMEHLRLMPLCSRYIRTGILNDAAIARITSKGVVFAEIEDAAEALMRIVCDTSVCGEY